MESLPSYWVGLEVPGTDCHITLVFRDDCTPEDLERLEKGVKDVLQPLLPLEFQIGGYHPRGTPPDIPAYNVFVKSSDPHTTQIDNVLQTFYHAHTHRSSEKPQYPRLEYHISCKWPGQREQLEKIINTQDGKIAIREAYIRPLGSKQDVLRVTSSDPSDPQWATKLVTNVFPE